jgi:ankyrin repeat protein
VKLLPLLTLCFIYVLPALAMEIEHKKIKVDEAQSDAPIEKVPSLTELVTHFLARYEMNEEQSLTSFRTKLNQLYSILPNHLTLSFFSKVLRENKQSKKIDEVDLAIILAEYLMQRSIDSDQALVQKSSFEKLAYIRQHAQPGSIEQGALKLIDTALNHPVLADKGQLRSTARAVCFGCPLVLAALVQAQKEKGVNDLAQALRQLIYLRKDNEACALIDLLPAEHPSFNKGLEPELNLLNYALMQGCTNTQQALKNKNIRPYLITNAWGSWYPDPWNQEGFFVGDVSRVSSFITEFPEAIANSRIKIKNQEEHILNTLRLESNSKSILPLLYALEHGHTGVAQILLDHGADPCVEDSGGDTTLSLACALNDVALVHRLLMSSAKKYINQRTVTGKSPLHSVCVQGNLPLVELLLSNGADVNLKVQSDRKKFGLGVEFPYLDGSTPLHLACSQDSQEIAAFLIEHGANIQELNLVKDDALSSACKNKSFTIVPLLVSKAAQLGLDMNSFIQDKHLINAISEQQDAILELFLKYRTNPPSVAVLNSACQQSNTKYVNRILEAGTSFIEQDHNGDTPLHCACKSYKSFDSALLLLEKAQANFNEESYNKYINTKNKENLTPFLLACVNRNNRFIKYFLDSFTSPLDQTALYHYLCFNYNSVPVELSMVELLFKQVLDINAKYEGNTLLDQALKLPNSFPTANFLISKGADTTLKGEEDGDTPLHVYCFYGAKDLAVLKLLVENGADVNAKNVKGETPLHHVILNDEGALEEDKKSMLFLLEHGADRNAADNDGNTPLHIACKRGMVEYALFLVEQGALCTVKNNKGDSLIHYECHHGAQNLELIKLFLSKGVVLDKNLKGKTPLHYCVNNEHVDEERQKATITFLLEQGIDINQTDNDGNTILHYAYEQNTSSIIKFLIEKGASESIKNKNGKIPRMNLPLSSFHISA